ncbi:hypothetical protein HYS54_04680 [Candidatus Micrarchaeota archaeon]|nr:hypothetical protein [Candidatus Micrarchaeota archaeon]
MMTTLLVRKETRDALKALGQKGETYDQIIQRLISGQRGPHPSVHSLPPGSEGHDKAYA